jgi:hypothetical protein
MPKLTPDERAARMKKIRAQAQESVAKREQFNFRLDTDTINRLYALAAQQRKPVGALVREWVAERIQIEEQSRDRDEPTLVSLAQDVKEIKSTLRQVMERIAPGDEYRV